MDHPSGPEEQFIAFDVALGKPLVFPTTGSNLPTSDLTIPVEGRDEITRVSDVGAAAEAWKTDRCFLEPQP